MSKAFRAKTIEVIEIGNIGIYADFGSDSEDDDREKKEIEKEGEEIRDFVRCHPLPSLEDKEGNKFWVKVIKRLKEESGKDGSIYLYVYEI